MKSKDPQMRPNQTLDPKTPHTKHEEIMFCIESTNEIVSKILELLEESKKLACLDCIYHKKQVMGVIG